MKKILLLIVTLTAISLSANSQIKNEFIKKGKAILYPFPIIEKSLDKKDFRYGLDMEFAYMPLNRFEIRPGMSFALGFDNYWATSLAVRYYLLKSSFTLFPEIYSSYAFKSKFFKYNFAIGMGYYGILKRIGFDLLLCYSPSYPSFARFYPSLKLKVLLGKLDKDKDN